MHPWQFSLQQWWLWLHTALFLLSLWHPSPLPWGWSSFSPPLHNMGSIHKIILYSSGRFLLTGVFKPFLHYRHPKQPFQTIFFQLPLLLPMEHLKSQIVYRSVYVLYWSVLCIGKEVFFFPLPNQVFKFCPLEVVSLPLRMHSVTKICSSLLRLNHLPPAMLFYGWKAFFTLIFS